ncbi:hypothetical protein Tco_0327591 [Tanacetum coccineum]
MLVTPNGISLSDEDLREGGGVVGLGFEPPHGGFPSGAKKRSGVYPLKRSYISLHDLNVIRCNCIILGDPKPFSGNKTPSVNKFKPPKLEEDHVDPDVNDDRHHADEPTAPKQKRSSCSQTQSGKRQRQSSDDKEDVEIGACFEKLEKLGWGEGPMYDTAVLLFGESSGYRKIWLHLKPKSSVNWVKNAGEVDHLVSFYVRNAAERKSGPCLCLNVIDMYGCGEFLALSVADSTLEKQDPMYNTAIFLFGENADYRKLWLLLKTESCGKWVKNAGIKLGWSLGCIAYDIFVSNKLRKVSDYDHVDPDLNEDVDDGHHKEPPALNQNLSDSTRKCSGKMSIKQ